MKWKRINVFRQILQKLLSLKWKNKQCLTTNITDTDKHEMEKRQCFPTNITETVGHEVEKDNVFWQIFRKLLIMKWKSEECSHIQMQQKRTRCRKKKRCGGLTNVPKLTWNKNDTCVSLKMDQKLTWNLEDTWCYYWCTTNLRKDTCCSYTRTRP